MKLSKLEKVRLRSLSSLLFDSLYLIKFLKKYDGLERRSVFPYIDKMNTNLSMALNIAEQQSTSIIERSVAVDFKLIRNIHSDIDLY